jgi:hypothetical protein
LGEADEVSEIQRPGAVRNEARKRLGVRLEIVADLVERDVEPGAKQRLDLRAMVVGGRKHLSVPQADRGYPLP